MSDDGLPTDTALYDDEISMPLPETSKTAGTSPAQSLLRDQQSLRTDVTTQSTAPSISMATNNVMGLQTRPTTSATRRDTSNFEVLKGRSVRIVGGQQLELQLPRQMQTALQNAPEYILENNDNSHS